MPTFEVSTVGSEYSCVVERGVLGRVSKYLPKRSGKVFIVTNEEVWRLWGSKLTFPAELLFLPPGETSKRFEHLEALAEQMVEAGGDRTSLVIALGGGIVTDMAGFLAAVFMRGIPVVQIPTTLLAQVDAAVGGKTGVNLKAGKNLLGSFHQPAAVLIDPEVLASLPEREYRAGLFEVIKHGIIASPELFRTMDENPQAIIAQRPDLVDYIISESVRIKAEVVSADEKESDLRRTLNFGHTIGHALEGETGYARFLHGEAVSFGMSVATHLSALVGVLSDTDRDTILRGIAKYGPIPALDGIEPDALVHRTVRDKKTVGGKVHFVLVDRIGHTVIRSGIPEETVAAAVRAAVA